MKFVLKNANVPSPCYLRLDGGEAGKWETVSDLNDATVFTAQLGDQFDKVTVKPFWPFDQRDYERDYPKSYQMVAVRLNTVAEV